MTFPTITFKTTNAEQNPALQTLATNKLAGLAKFIHDGAHARCEVEFVKETTHHTGNIYRVEVNLMINGTMHRAVSTESSFETAIDIVRAELYHELDKKTSKRETMLRRGGRMLKSLMQRGG
jgi:ribosomal subunit interface protein